jgi:ketol-acid reductoisomerase
VLGEIQSGEFAHNSGSTRTSSGRANFHARRKQESELLVEKVGAELRAKMSWQQDGAK